MKKFFENRGRVALCLTLVSALGSVVIGALWALATGGFPSKIENCALSIFAYFGIPAVIAAALFVITPLPVAFVFGFSIGLYYIGTPAVLLIQAFWGIPMKIILSYSLFILCLIYSAWLVRYGKNQAKQDELVHKEDTPRKRPKKGVPIAVRWIEAYIVVGILCMVIKYIPVNHYYEPAPIPTEPVSIKIEPQEPELIHGYPPDTIAYVSNGNNFVHSKPDCPDLTLYRTMTVEEAYNQRYPFCWNCWFRNKRKAP